MFSLVSKAKEWIMAPLTRSASRMVLFGPPCCGKGTLAQRLVKRLQYPHISTGEIFRQHLSEQTKYGEEIKHCMQEGNLIPDYLVTRMTFDTLEKYQDGYILDGFPRTMAQAEALHDRFGWPHVIHLDTDDETIIARLAGRITCASCGSVFNHLFCPPKVEDICDHCSGELIKRVDDTRETAIQRLQTYHRETEPLVDLYRKYGLLTTIPTGVLTPDEIYHRVIDEIDSR